VIHGLDADHAEPGGLGEGGVDDGARDAVEIALLRDSVRARRVEGVAREERFVEEPEGGVAALVLVLDAPEPRGFALDEGAERLGCARGRGGGAVGADRGEVDGEVDHVEGVERLLDPSRFQ